ncbi:hypothetical protein ACFVWT_04255 [Arthrobacter sp. NPDC058288]|uniref:hypothetical protein n=1 Tax=Arthrobacter sp. NPDC058288 TaxID=3346424 RepID=UPI0036EBCE6F
MTDYPYESQLVADPLTFQRAVNSSVTVYDIDDTSESTPLALKDLSGLPLANPVTSSADAFTPPFIAPADGVKLVGAGLIVPVFSPKGIRDAAEASALAAQEAAGAAATAGAAAADAATAQLQAATTSAATSATAATTAQAAAVAAQAAAEAAAAVSSGGGVALDPVDADTLLITTKTDGSVAIDPSDADAILITT